MFAAVVRRALMAAGLLAGTVTAAHAAPDAIFMNARVFTADAAQPAAQAFALQDGRILAIGSQDDILARKGPQTQVVDLQGRRVLPGLIDAHTHALIGGLAALSPNLNDEELDIAVVRQRVQAWHDERSGDAGAPLVVFGVNPGTWKTPQALAAVFDAGAWASRPLLLMGSDLHTAWVNRAMRARAGIDAAYVRGLSAVQRHTVGVDADGEPDGILVDAGVDLATLTLPRPDTSALLAAGRFAVRANNRYGITAWMDPAANAGPGEALFSRTPDSTGAGVLPGYRALAEAGDLTAHVAALLVASPLSDAAFMGQYPARSLQAQGAVIAGASDWPISTANPWEAMHHAMTRHGPNGGLNPAERLDRTSMLLAYTRHAAQAIGLSERIGSLSPGKQADFIVVDRDVLEVDVEALKQTQVLETYFAGVRVHAAD